MSSATVIGPTPPGFGDSEARDLGDAGMHVAVDLALAGLGVGLARHADVEHRGAGLDVLGAHEVLDARRRDDDVGLTQVAAQVDRAGVGQRDRRVDTRGGSAAARSSGRS